MKRTALIFEPCLGAISGHWENLASRLTQALTKQNFNVVIWSNRCQDQIVDKTLPTRPIFEQLPYILYDDPEFINATITKDRNAFMKIDIAEFGPDPLLIFPTVYPHILEAAMPWLMHLLDYKLIRASQVVFIFQFPYSLTKEKITEETDFKTKIMHQAQMIKRLCKRIWQGHDIKDLPFGEESFPWVETSTIFFAANQRKLLHASPFKRFYAVSPQLAKIFSTLYELPVKELPMPMPLTKQPTLAAKAPAKLKVGYFGHAAVEKGSLFLAELLDLAHSHSIELHFHLNPNNPAVEAAFEVFKHPRENVHCYWGHLTEEEMTRKISELNILILPYSPLCYAAMPSAMFSEAVLLGKVMVIPAETWLAQQATKFSAGVTLFHEHNAAAIKQAVITAIEHYQELQQASDNAIEPFKQYHNVDNFITTILKDGAPTNTLHNKVETGAVA